MDERASCPSVAEDEDAGPLSALLLDFGQAVANLVQEHVSLPRSSACEDMKGKRRFLFRRLHFNEVLDDPGGDVMQLICLDYLQLQNRVSGTSPFTPSSYMWNLLGNNLLRIKSDRRGAEKELLRRHALTVHEGQPPGGSRRLPWRKEFSSAASEHLPASRTLERKDSSRFESTSEESRIFITWR